MTQYYTLLTDIGRQAITNAEINNTKVDFAYIAVGDGNGTVPTPNSAQTALVNEVWRGSINKIYIHPDNSSWIVIEAIIPAADGDFWIREIGVFDVNNNLLLVGNYPETYKPTLADGTSFDMYIRVILETANTSVVNLSVDPSVVLADKKYVDDAIILHDTDPNAHPEILNLVNDSLQTVSPISKPSIISPVGGATGFWSNIQSSQFQTNNYFFGIHEASDWEIATDNTFTNIVENSYDDRVNLTSYLPKNLQPNTTYYVRVRYKSDNHVSDWSEPVSFTTGANRPPEILSINWSSNVLYDNSSYTVEIIATDTDGDSLTYFITASDPNITITQDTTNPALFTIIFPDYAVDTTVDFAYSVSDGTNTVFQAERKTILDFTEFVGTSTAANFGQAKTANYLSYDSSDLYFTNGNDAIYKLDTIAQQLSGVTIGTQGINDIKLINGELYIVADNVLRKFDRNLFHISGKQLPELGLAIGEYNGNLCVVSGDVSQVYVQILTTEFTVIKTTLFTYPTSYQVIKAIIRDGFVYIFGVDTTTNDLYISKINIDTMTQITRSYNLSFDSGALQCTLDANGNIYIGTLVGTTTYIYKLDNELWFIKSVRNNTSSDYFGSITAIGESIYVGLGTLDYYILQLDLELNTKKALHITSSSSSSNDNILYCDGIITLGSFDIYRYLLLMKLEISSFTGTISATTNTTTFTVSESTYPLTEVSSPPVQTDVSANIAVSDLSIDLPRLYDSFTVSTISWYYTNL